MFGNLASPFDRRFYSYTKYRKFETHPRMVPVTGCDEFFFLIFDGCNRRLRLYGRPG